MIQAKWKKADVKAAIQSVALSVGRAFGIATPETFVPDYLPAREWEYRFDTVEVWTIAGPAELNVTIDNQFAHMYFRFDDPGRALELLGPGRLNHHSGKWNRLASASASLSGFANVLAQDFARVADTRPDPAEVDSWKARKAAEAAQWAKWREEFAQHRQAAQGAAHANVS
ncbi:hypothetical protein [Billgrantia desiderata]|uniref:hypothetical protein n=1 Tax=Billgrantia desiderata TaxID=52021 RepID=UPI001F1B3EE6|nr:hypothetical protein [Halomonas desiderata]MCE8012855.1 hypothetical protein [Halomonas desiderata]